jgi:osmotically-inducible protein OsmY
MANWTQSNWTRGDRDEAGRYIEPGREGPAFPDRWRGRQAGREPRSFDVERDWADPTLGGYTGEGLSRSDVRGPYLRSAPERAPEDGPEDWPENRDAREAFDRYGVRGARDYRGEVPRFRGEPADRGWEDVSARYGRGIAGVNPALDAVADDSWERGEGPHRGRGPKAYVRSDGRILDDVSDRLADDSWLDASDIEVQVADGEVTLSGTVEHRRDKRHAEDLAERVSGVKHVQNNLRARG